MYYIREGGDGSKTAHLLVRIFISKWNSLVDEAVVYSVYGKTADDTLICFANCVRKDKADEVFDELINGYTHAVSDGTPVCKHVTSRRGKIVKEKGGE